MGCNCEFIDEGVFGFVVLVFIVDFFDEVMEWVW